MADFCRTIENFQ